MERPEAFGVGSDCVFGGTIAAGNATSCQLTTAWEIYLALTSTTGRRNTSDRFTVPV